MKARILIMLAAMLLLLSQNVRANMNEDFPPPVEFEEEMNSDYPVRQPAARPYVAAPSKHSVPLAPVVGKKYTKKAVVQNKKIVDAKSKRKQAQTQVLKKASGTRRAGK